MEVPHNRCSGVASGPGREDVNPGGEQVEHAAKVGEAGARVIAGRGPHGDGLGHRAGEPVEASTLSLPAETTWMIPASVDRRTASSRAWLPPATMRLMLTTAGN